MVDHINSHINNKKYQCIICKSRFVKSSHVIRHTQRHKEEKVKCNECKTLFYSKDNLKRHTLVCKRSHPCEICGESFESNKEYSKHLRTHKEIQKVYVKGHGT
ncbi:Zinc finger protein 449 [Nosema bombycis CQ1]|uniref:Zinc finger protein 449 n=1 Tax=Nosema bombycis (strain CQ1 / CVCC 102059) TaxID=578461 RepID=R0KVS4_NOSB1|nr:Zinc finger protein 449 [Nosema bombycis CQ1]|eukprot:EOB14996.1 Zinc finger protein 449 [Nosema bombycis CQ1]